KHSQRSRKSQSLWQSSGVSLPSPKLSEASAIRGRCRAGCLAKGRRERTRFAEADRQRDLGDRARGPRQERLGVVDATSVVIAVGRHAERPLEGPAEMIRAQPNTVREGSERYLLGDVFFDVRGHDPLLPGGETAARRRFDAARSSAAAHELMRQRRPWACGRVCKPWRPRARSYHSPGITGTADAHFRKPDSGPTRGTFAAARDQRPVGAKPLWRGYVGASALARWTTVLSIAYGRAATLASPGLLLILLLAGSNLFMRFVTKQRRMPRYQRPR